jgi:ATP-dependent Zn protease
MQEPNWLVNLIISWVPFIVLVIVWIWLSRSMGMRWRGRNGASMIELYEQQVLETRRMNATLERIALALEKRAQG